MASEIRSSANPFYQALDRLLEKHGFDTFAEDTCRAFYVENRGRPGIPPGVYFRMMMVGYLEGIGSERGIALPSNHKNGLATGLLSAPTRTARRLAWAVWQPVRRSVFQWMPCFPAGSAVRAAWRVRYDRQKSHACTEGMHCHRQSGKRRDRDGGTCGVRYGGGRSTRS